MKPYQNEHIETNLKIKSVRYFWIFIGFDLFVVPFWFSMFYVFLYFLIARQDDEGCLGGSREACETIASNLRNLVAA